jgi:hypothetical protein
LDSIEAKKREFRWGVPHGEQVDTRRPHDLSRNLAKFGHTSSFWKRKLEIVNEKKEKASKVYFAFFYAHQALMSSSDAGA